MILCTCGKKMLCKQTRSDGKKVLRRYHCDCGERVTTIEYIAEWVNGELTLHFIDRSSMGEEPCEQS